MQWYVDLRQPRRRKPCLVELGELFEISIGEAGQLDFWDRIDQETLGKLQCWLFLGGSWQEG